LLSLTDCDQQRGWNPTPVSFKDLVRTEPHELPFEIRYLQKASAVADRARDAMCR